MKLKEREEAYKDRVREMISNRGDWRNQSECITGRSIIAYEDIFEPFRKRSQSYELKFEKGMKVLDLGCGQGLAVYGIAPKVIGKKGKVIGVDFTSGFMSDDDYKEWQIERGKYAPEDYIAKHLEEIMSARRAREFRVVSAERLPFGDDTFDIVVSSYLLPYITNKGKVIQEMIRVLKPDGKCYVVNGYSKGMSDAIMIETTKMINEQAGKISDTYETMEEVYAEIKKNYDEKAKEYNLKSFLETYYEDVHVLPDRPGDSQTHRIYLITKEKPGIKLKKPLPTYISFIMDRSSADLEFPNSVITLVRPRAEPK